MSIASWIRQKIGTPSTSESNDQQSLGEMKFLLLDIDLTGTDAKRDSVTGLAALPLVNGLFQPDNLRYCRFVAEGSAKPGSETDIATAYRSIHDLMGGSKIVTINPTFVRHMLEQTAARHNLPLPIGEWLELSDVSRVIGSDTIPATSLSYWRKKMKTCGRHEHDAVYDVFAMAQLFQALLAYAEDSGIQTLADLMRNENAENWLRPY